MKIGSKVEHILSKDWLLVLEVDEDMVLCRTKDYEELWFFAFELKPV